jgi:hypothetical protein
MFFLFFVLLLAPSGPKMETVCFSETFLSTYEYTWRQKSEEHHPRRRENPQATILILITVYVSCDVTFSSMQTFEKVSTEQTIR